MNIAQERSVAVSLWAAVSRPEGGDPSIHEFVGIADQRCADQVLECPQNFQESEFVWIGSGVTDPVHLLWLLANKGVLADLCFVVFTGVRDSPSWADLVRAYGGARFGNFFFMVYRGNTRPGIYPSQRGLYMK